MRRWWTWLLLMASALLLVDDAEARMGGGQDFGGGGGGGSSSGGSGSGGGGGEAALLRLLLWLCLEHPIVGIPLTLCVVGGWIWMQRKGKGGRTYHAHERRQRSEPREAPRREAQDSSFAQLRERDPNFSPLLFQDLVQLVFIRGHEARRTGDFGAVLPFLAPKAQQMLRKGVPADISDVIIGASRIKMVRVRGVEAQVMVDFEANVTEEGQHTYLREVWTFRRRADSLSPGPDKMQALRCISCGAAIETDVEGRCRHCETPLADGRLQWQCLHIVSVERRPVKAPELALGGGGKERGYDNPTRMHRELPAQLRALSARHPDFGPQAFRDWVGEIFVALQDAWATQRWERARPYLTDPLFQSLRYQIEQHRRAKLTNHCEQVRVDKVEIARVGLDAYYESITVRVFASMVDYTADASGKVLGGDKKKPRVFSEYWTFVRAAGHQAGVKSSQACPSCGAPLDRVDLGGVCGYCETRITGGEHSWVLSTISQDQVTV